MRLKEDKTLWSNKWMAVKETDDDYTYIQDQSGKFVAVLGIAGNKIVGRFEEVPPHKDGIKLVSLTGGIEDGEKPADAVLRELKEESGISVKKDKLIDLGTIRPSKGTNSTGYLYAVEVKEKKGKFSGKGDGTEHEKKAYCKFVPLKEALNSKDSILITMVARYVLREML